MLTHLFVFCFCIISIEILIAGNMLASIQYIYKKIIKSTHVILSKKISDHWKEKVVVNYSFLIMKESIKLLAIFIIIIVVFIFLSFINAEFAVLLSSFLGVVETFIIFFIYFKIRKYYNE